MIAKVSKYPHPVPPLKSLQRLEKTTSSLQTEWDLSLLIWIPKSSLSQLVFEFKTRAGPERKKWNLLQPWWSPERALQGPHLLQHLLLWGKGPDAAREENTQLKGGEQLRPDAQGFFSSNLGSDPLPSRRVTAMEQKGSPTSRPTLGPPSLAPPQRKTWDVSTSNPAILLLRVYPEKKKATN